MRILCEGTGIVGGMCHLLTLICNTLMYYDLGRY
jgi:hypothetical protein